jgi:formate dehydrogenase subunit gamma
MVLVKTGPILAVTALAHRLSTIAFTGVIVGHIVIAAGILPGYRGAWRSMHLGGRLRLDTARRPWPGWTERQPGRSEAPMGATSRHGEAARARAASNGEARVTG